MHGFTEDAVKQLKILVVGDVMLDRYIDGEVTRISPEDPTCLVLNQAEQTYHLGGAANVARNLASLGVDVRLIGFGGTKNQNDKFHSVLSADKGAARITYTLVDAARRLTIKSRFRAHGKQLLRVDYESSGAPTAGVAKKLTEAVFEEIDTVAPDITVLSDYGKGALADVVLKDLTALLDVVGIRYVVDPKRPDLEMYWKPLVICPNEYEWEQTQAAGRRSLAEHTVVTRGSRGCTLVPTKHGDRTATTPVDFPVEPVEMCDSTGAGDTFISAMAVAMCCGQTIEQACNIANALARVSVMSPGASAPTIAQALENL